VSTRKKRPPSNRKPAENLVSIEADSAIFEENKPNPNPTADQFAQPEIKQPIKDELSDIEIFKTKPGESKFSQM